MKRRYLGRLGIHGFGIRAKQDAVCVYLDEICEPQQEGLNAMRRDAAPHQLIAIEEPRPSRSSSD
jgi:hypothetical protein